MQVSGSGLAARRRWRSGDGGFYRRELSLFAGAYVVYNAARWLFTGDLSRAQWHAESIMRLERELGLAVEASVQQCLDAGLWSPFFSYVYMAAQLGGAEGLGVEPLGRAGERGHVHTFGRGHLQRSDRNVSRTSSESSCGCSQAAK